MEQISANKCFDGRQLRYSHASRVLGCDMTFSIFLPPQAEQGKVPVVYWLSGLTCTDENFVAKAGAQRYAAELGLAVVAPDTSPRGEGVPDDPDGAWDFGLGAERRLGRNTWLSLEAGVGGFRGLRLSGSDVESPDLDVSAAPYVDIAIKFRPSLEF